MIGIIKYFDKLPYFCGRGTAYIGGLGLKSSMMHLINITEDNISDITV